MKGKMKREEIRLMAPWPIPRNAHCILEKKQEYWQYKFTWRRAGWRYEARLHSKTPGARLITYPSWRLDRIRPGKGFGPDHAPRLSEIKVGQRWLDADYVRYCARQVSRQLASKKQIEVIEQAHVRAKNYGEA